MCHVTPYAASAAHISRFAAPTFRCRPTGLTLHAGLEPYNRYRDLAKYFFINEKIFRTIEKGQGLNVLVLSVLKFWGILDGAAAQDAMIIPLFILLVIDQDFEFQRSEWLVRLPYPLIILHIF